MCLYYIATQLSLLCFLEVFQGIVVVSGLKITTDMVAKATNFFSLATKNSGLVATLVTRFLYDLDLN